MQAKRQIKIDLKCHWKDGKIILFHLLKQTLGVSELTGLCYQTLWAKHCCWLININVTAIDCLYVLPTLIKARSWVCTLCITLKPCWHAAHSFLNIYSSKDHPHSEHTIAKAFPLLPSPYSPSSPCPVGISVKWPVSSPSLWSQPQITNSRRKSHRQDFDKGKDVLLERLDLKAIMNTSLLLLQQHSTNHIHWCSASQSDSEGSILSTV